MKRKIIALSVSTALLSFSTIVNATGTATNGNLTFTFSGNIPALPSDGGNWSFVQADGTTEYVAPSSISLSSRDTEDGVQLTSTSETFYIKPDSSASFTSGSKITATLTSEPTISGTAVKPSAAGTVTINVTINGVTVPTGTSADVATPSGTEATRLVLGTVIDIPTAARTNGGGVLNVSAPIRFAATIG